MTLPFRRRHHDDEGSHDRARALVSIGFLEPLVEADASWLEGHLGRCAECRAEREALIADRALLRGLRDRMPEPPRDLWARTAAAIESRQRPGRRRRLLDPGPFPAAALSAALVVLVVLGTTLLQPSAPPPLPGGPTGSPAVAQASSLPAETPLAVNSADEVAWIQKGADGSYALVFAAVDQVCHHTDPECAPLAPGSPAPLKLTDPPQAVALSPGHDQVAVVSAAADSGSVTIVEVPTQAPEATATPTLGAPTSPAPSASGSAAPEIGHVIVRDVMVVGSISYSADGQWLAFSAKPRDGSRGADLYVWHVGDAEAIKVSDDGATYFSGWYQNQILASTVHVFALVLDAASSPATESPSPSDDAASPSPAASSSPAPSLDVGGVHPISYLIAPETGEREAFHNGVDIWMPSVDLTGRFVTYWAGTVIPVDPAISMPIDPSEVGAWRPATGALVLDGWSAPLPPIPSPATSGAPSTSEPETAGPATAAPSETAEPPAPTAPGEALGEAGATPGTLLEATMPAGTPIVLAAGPIADFDAQFDPTGSRLAVWVKDSLEASAGRLWLVVLDPATGTISPTIDPMGLPGAQALPGFSIEAGRLGWVTPAGQDGQPSSVQVLAWEGDEFGQVESRPGGSLQIVR